MGTLYPRPHVQENVTSCACKRPLLQISLRVGSLGPLQRQNLLGTFVLYSLSVTLKITDVNEEKVYVGNRYFEVGSFKKF